MRIITILILFTTSIYSQNISSQKENNLGVDLVGVELESYHSIGFSNIGSSSISYISSANPASLKKFDKIAFGISYSYFPSTKSNISYIPLTYNKAKEWIPNSIGIVYPYHSFKFGIAYYQKYNVRTQMKVGEIRTFEQPEGTGEYFSATEETIIHSPSFLVSYSLNGIISNADFLSIGIQGYWDFLSLDSKFWHSHYRVKGNNLTWKVGLLYGFNQNINIGFIYQKGTKPSGILDTGESTLRVVDIEPQNSDNNYKLINYEPEYVFSLPDKFALGITAGTLDDLLFTITLSSVYWENISTNTSEYGDQFELSAGVIYGISDNLKLSLGFYNSTFNKEGSQYLLRISNNTHLYDVAIQWYLNNFDIQLELMDNSLLTSKSESTTQAKIALNYSL